MEQLIPIVNKLQEVFHNIGMLDTIDLPQIVVVGSQSSGKSSVLEAIVGRDFLPRGTGIVTRRPLVLQLVKNDRNPSSSSSRPSSRSASPTRASSHEDGAPSSSNSASPSSLKIEQNGHAHHPSEEQDEWGEFQHFPDRRFFDFEEIRKEIERETERITGSNKGVHPMPIVLKIVSPRVVSLTLVDLPGYVRVPVGDQPVDIEAQVRKMIVQFISKPNSIILAVTPANVDLASSDALKLAREFDPEGERTIGVLTKLDLMDPGTDAVDILQGNVIQLRRGFIGVVNRGQQDIVSRKSISNALRDEEQWFTKHAATYRPVAARLGVPVLARHLSSILLSHIRSCLPELRSRISSLITKTSAILSEHGQPLDKASRALQGKTILDLLARFTTLFSDTVKGRSSELPTSEVFGGARIHYIFSEVFGRCLLGLDAFAGLSDRDIRTVICNAKGSRSSFLVPIEGIETLVKIQIGHLEQPCNRVIDLVHDELVRILESCDRPLQRFPALRYRVMDVAAQLLTSYMQPLREFVTSLIKIEKAYINTNHPDFVSALSRVPSMSPSSASSSSTTPSSASAQSASIPVPLSSDSQRSQSLPSVLPVADNALPSVQGRTSSLPGASAGDFGGLRSTWEAPQQQPQPQKKNWNLISGLLGYGSSEQPQQSSSSSAPSASPTFSAPIPSASSSSNLPPLHSGGSQSYQDFSASFPMSRPRSASVGSSQQNVHSSGSSRLSDVPMTLRVDVSMSDRERAETEYIKNLLECYFNIVRKNIMDSVPKSVMCFLVKKAEDELHSELTRTVFREELFPELLRESEDVVARRECAESTLLVLQKAQDILSEVRDYRMSSTSLQQ